MRAAPMHLAVTRKRTIDEDFKREVMQKSSTGQSSAGAVAKVIGCVDRKTATNWGLELLPAHQIQGQLYWQLQQVLSVAYDASRFGVPKEETKLYAVTDGRFAGWTPGQVFHALSKCVCC